MKKFIYVLFVLFLFSCEKEEITSVLSGNWKLVNVSCISSATNDYTGDWHKSSLYYNGDTLFYSTTKGINYNETVSSTQLNFMYTINMQIDKDNSIIIQAYKKEIESGTEYKGEINTRLYEGDFDNSIMGGGKYNLKISFGNNDYSLWGINDDEPNTIFAIKDDIIGDSLTLRWEYKSTQPASESNNYKYTFIKR
jgi:hypothetical protein